MSAEATITLHKEVSTDMSHAPSFTLQLAVTDAVGITPCIFVHDYIPRSPITGEISYDFTNVAYLDELTEIADFVEDKNHKISVRKSRIDKSFSSFDALTEFLDIVYKDIRRLLTQVKTVTILTPCEDVEITAESMSVTPVACDSGSDDSVVEDGDSQSGGETAGTESIVLSYNGKLAN